MKRNLLATLAFMSVSSVPMLAQEATWKPVQEHRARYETATGEISLLGKPIPGRSKLDQSVERTGFSELKPAAPLPVAPVNKPFSYETLPPPRIASGYMPASTPSPSFPKLAGRSYPVINYPAIPGGVLQQDPVTSPPEPGTTIPDTSGAIMQGPIYGEPILGSPYGGEYLGMGGEELLADRYYKQAIHGSPGIWYGSFEFVALNLNPDHAPALVVTGNQAPSATPPFFTVSNLRTIYGGELPNDTMYGGRVMMGFWFNRNQTWGLFGSYFTTNTSANSFQAASFDGTTFLARPFYDTNPALELPLFSPDREQLERVSDLGGQGGSVTINRNHMLRSADLNFRFNLWNNYPTCSRWNWHVDSYVGVKYMGLDESLSIREDLRAYADILGFPLTPGGYTLLFPAGTEITVIDQFRTRNNFIGANLGLMNEVRLGRIFMELRAGIALGTTYSEVAINGSTQYRLPNLPPTPIQNGGLLALPTNIGTYRSSAFSYIPEFGVKLGLQMTDHLRLYAGYDLAFWSNVVRPGQQIDRYVNTSQLPLVNPQTGAVVPSPLNGPAKPAFQFNRSDLWINGFNAGISWIF